MKRAILHFFMWLTYWVALDAGFGLGRWSKDVHPRLVTFGFGIAFGLASAVSVLVSERHKKKIKNSGPVWTWFAMPVMFVLLGINPIVNAVPTARVWGWSIGAVAIGIGVVTFVHACRMASAEARATAQRNNVSR
jgi:hypothetical protein